MTRTPADERQADVIVVGAGPAGASTAYHLAQAGADVLLLDKATFPRDKICGDGLTPRAVRQLVAMGFDLDEPGWQKNARPAHRRRRPPSRAALAGPHHLPAVRRGADPDGPRRAARAARPEVRRPAARGHQRHRPRPRRAHRTRRRRDREAGGRPRPEDRRRGDLPRAGRRGLRRRLLAPRDRAGPRAPGGPPDGGRGPRLLHDPAPRRPLDGVLAGAVGRQAEGEQPAPGLRLDLRRRRRHRQRRPRHPQLQRGLPARRLQADPAHLARHDAGGVGLPRREHGRPDRLGRAADGLQPQAARHATACSWSATPAGW